MALDACAEEYESAFDRSRVCLSEQQERDTEQTCVWESDRECMDQECGEQQSSNLPSRVAVLNDAEHECCEMGKELEMTVDKASWQEAI
jgi:hypothetical protein